MRTIAQFLFAVVPNQRARVATGSFVGSFSTCTISKRYFRTAGSLQVGRIPNRRIRNICKSATSLSERSGEHNWLVVGDGDFSYCASIAERLAKDDINLYATVLEEEMVHNKVYQRSISNKDSILSTTKTDSPCQHQVKFGIDATKLIEFFPTIKFQTIEFNFPHWGGKTNAKRNRQLLDDFMASASQVLSEDGEIVISLCEGQGGFPAPNGR